MVGTEPQSSALVVVGEICGGINVELPAQQDMTRSMMGRSVCGGASNPGWDGVAVTEGSIKMKLWDEAAG